MSEHLELVIDAKATLGEGPCWDPVNEVLYWVDIIEQKLHIYKPKTGSDRVVHLRQYVGTVVPRASGGVALAMQNGFYFLDLETECLEPVIDPESHIPTNRFNDGKCDPVGRFWAGTMDFNAAEGKGALYCLDIDHSCRKVLEPVSISNGLAWSADHRIMYYVDSATRKVVSFDYEISTGEINNQRTVVAIPEDGSVPDGMTIDEEGMLWVAQWDGWQVSRWNPHTGELLDVVRVPAARVTSCTFGGERLDTLYITTARIGLDTDSLLEQPLAGGVFAVKTKTRGLPANAYKS